MDNSDRLYRQLLTAEWLDKTPKFLEKQLYITVQLLVILWWLLIPPVHKRVIRFENCERNGMSFQLTSKHTTSHLQWYPPMQCYHFCNCNRYYQRFYKGSARHQIKSHTDKHIYSLVIFCLGTWMWCWRRRYNFLITDYSQ